MSSKHEVWNSVRSPEAYKAGVTKPLIPDLWRWSQRTRKDHPWLQREFNISLSYGRLRLERKKKVAHQTGTKDSINSLDL